MTGNSLNNTKVGSNISPISRYDVHTIIAEIIAKDSTEVLSVFNVREFPSV